MITIEAGVELDRAVAEATGLVYEKRPSPSYKARSILGMELLGWWDGNGYVGYDAPKPSTDLNSAFTAADRVGLFDGNQLGKWTPREYCVILSCDQPDERDIIGRAETAALAICAAILKLKESDDGG